MPPSPVSGASDRQGWRLENSLLIRYLLLFASGWATVLLIDYFAGPLALFTASGVLAALLHGPVVRLSRFLPRALAVAVVFFGAMGLLAALVTAIGFQLLNQGQGLLLHLTDALKGAQHLKGTQGLPLGDLLQRLELSLVADRLQAGLIAGLAIVQRSFSGVFTAIFAAVITLYMLIDGEKLWASCLRLLPARHRERVAVAFSRSFLGFLRGQLLLMLFLTLTTLVAFSLLQVNYPLLLAIIVGVIDAIPGIGATLGISLACLLILTSQGVGPALWSLLACLVLVQIQDNVLRPRVMAGALELNPVVMFASLFIGQRVAGLLGIFLAIPIAGTVALLLVSLRREGEGIAGQP
jgi:predicted PurR-regulated permease PerM